MGTSKQNQTRVTRIGNPTTYNGSDARITQSADKLVLDPKTGVIHYMYPDNRITRYTADWKDDPVETEVPEEYYDYWRNAFEQAKANAQPNLLQRGVHLVGRGIEKAGNWLQRFENGGTTQSAVSTEQDVMDTIDAAIGEIQTKRPGQAVQKLAAMMQDPSYSMIIDMVKQKYPQIEGVLRTVEQMVGAYKCGGKAKKKVKKGAKGCVPCKKLMRVGGKLINVLADCEGNIISKHQAGGWLIPKGGMGLITNRLLNEKYRKGATGDGTDGQFHYYLNDDNQWVGQKWNGNDWETISDLDQATLQTNALNWARGTKNAAGQFENPINDFFVNGFTWDYDKGSGAFLGNNGDALARTTLGEDVYNQGTVDGRVIRGVQGRSLNNWTSAEPVTALDPTADDYIDLFGVRGAFNREAGRFRDAFGTLRDQKRTLRREAFLTRRDDEAGNDYHMRDIRGSYRTAREGIRRDRANQMASLIDGTLNLWDLYSQNKGVYQAGSGRTGANGSYDNRIISNGQVGSARRDGYDSTLIHNGTLNSGAGPLQESVLPANAAAAQHLSSEMPEGYIDPTKGKVTGFRSVDGDLEANVDGTWVDGSEVSDALINAYRESERKRMMGGPSLSSKPIPLTNVPTTVQADRMNLSNAMSGYTPTNAEIRQRNRANAKEERLTQRDIARDQRQSQRLARQEGRRLNRQAGVSASNTAASTFTPELVNFAVTEMTNRFAGKQNTASAAAANTLSSPRTLETNLSTAPTRPVGDLSTYQRPSLVKNGVYATTTPYNVNEAAARVNSMKIAVPTWDVQNLSQSVINTPKIGARSQGGWLTKFN